MHWTALVVLLLLCYAVAVVGAFITRHNLAWYADLIHPSFTPPDRVFAPVWTILYGLMAVAAWLVWRATRRSRRDIAGNFARVAARKDALALFGIQLAFNFAWTFSFFHLHRLLVSVAVILILWIAIVATIILFWRIRTLAGLLLLPYLAWVSFATALNLFLLRLN